MTTIMGIRLDNRTQTAVDFQKTLTEYGCIIKTRLGLHNASASACSPNGIILLEVIDDEQAKEFKNALSAIEGIEIQVMQFV